MCITFLYDDRFVVGGILYSPTWRSRVQLPHSTNISVHERDLRIHEELHGLVVRVIVKAKQHSQRPVIGWVTKIYYFELLRA
jgi:hypothetical protein